MKAAQETSCLAGATNRWSVRSYAVTPEWQSLNLSPKVRKSKRTNVEAPIGLNARPLG